MTRPNGSCAGPEGQGTALDRERMGLAVAEARLAERDGDVPVGAVIVLADGRVVGRGRNRRELRQDATAHAEVEALRDASEHLGSWRLHDATMYVTLEPCLMCAGAILHARLRRVVYGARDAKAGAVDSLFVVGRDPRLNHRFEVVAGVEEKVCSELLSAFFRRRR